MGSAPVVSSVSYGVVKFKLPELNISGGYVIVNVNAPEADMPSPPPPIA